MDIRSHRRGIELRMVNPVVERIIKREGQHAVRSQHRPQLSHQREHVRFQGVIEHRKSQDVVESLPQVGDGQPFYATGVIGEAVAVVENKMRAGKSPPAPFEGFLSHGQKTTSP